MNEGVMLSDTFYKRSVAFDQWNTLIHKFKSQWKEDKAKLVTGSQVVTSKGSPGLAIDFEKFRTSFFLIKGVRMYP
jgi:hypothetical protein